MPRSVQQVQLLLRRALSASPRVSVSRWLADSIVLRAAWDVVRAQNGARTAGADGIAPAQLAHHPDRVQTLLFDLAEQIRSGSYKPGPLLRFDRPKDSQPGKTRPLAILTVADRVVHVAMKLILEPLIEPLLTHHCFGFRPGKSRFDQLMTMRRLVHHSPQQFERAIRADVASCFDELDHALILDDLARLLHDPPALEILRRILQHGSMKCRGFWRRRPLGVLQGSPLSPLLANLNLTRFDRAWEMRFGRNAPALRYADDLIILTSAAEAQHRLDDLQQLLQRTNHLRLAQDKTRLHTFEDGVPALGLMLRRSHDPFDGQERLDLVLDPERIRATLETLRARVDRWSAIPPLTAHDSGVLAEQEVARRLADLNQTLIGWFDAYQDARDAPYAFEVIDRCAFRQVAHALRRIFSLGSSALQSRFEIRLPSGHPTWQIGSQTLLVLSARVRRFRPPRSRCHALNSVLPSPGDPMTAPEPHGADTVSPPLWPLDFECSSPAIGRPGPSRLASAPVTLHLEGPADQTIPVDLATPLHTPAAHDAVDSKLAARPESGAPHHGT